MSQKGFTLIELLIVISIFVILFAIVGTLSRSALPSSQIKVEADVIEMMLRKAQARTVSQHANSVWGAHFTSTQATLFAGSDYASRDISYDEVHELPSAVVLSGLSDVVFQFRTGETSNTGTITLTHNATGQTRMLTINTVGLVEQ